MRRDCTSGTIARIGLACGVVLAALAIAGCDASSLRADPTDNSTRILGRRAWVIVTTDGGRKLVARRSVRLERGDTALDVLSDVADVRLDPQGAVAQVNGLGGGGLSTFGTDMSSWFYRVDGIEETVHPTRFLVRPGQSIWWDLRRFDAYRRIPVAVGVFPEPLFSGRRDTQRPLRISYGTGFAKDAEFLRETIFEELDPDVVSIKGDEGIAGFGGEDDRGAEELDMTVAVRKGSTNLVIARWEEALLDPYVADIGFDPRTYGLTAWMEGQGGTEIRRQDPDMDQPQRLADGVGVVWATTIDGEPDSTVVFMVTGITDAGVRGAARALRSGSCQFYLACVVDADGAVIR